MRISDLFGDNKNVALVNFYTSQYGITVPENTVGQMRKLQSDCAKFFVFIDEKGAEILQMRERSTLVGKIVGGRIRRGVVLYFHDGACRTVTRENWRETWAMIVPKTPVPEDDRIIVPVRKRTAFDDAMPTRPAKKMHKRGFSQTERSARNMYLLG